MATVELANRLKLVSKLAYQSEVPSEIRNKFGDVYFTLREPEKAPGQTGSGSDENSSSRSNDRGGKLVQTSLSPSKSKSLAAFASLIAVHAPHYWPPLWCDILEANKELDSNLLQAVNIATLLLFDEIAKVQSSPSDDMDKTILLIQKEEAISSVNMPLARSSSTPSDLFLVSLLSCELFQFADLFEAELFLSNKEALKSRNLLSFRVIIEGFELEESLDFVKRLRTDGFNAPVLIRCALSNKDLVTLDSLTLCSDDFSFLKLFALSMFDEAPHEQSQTQSSASLYTPIIEQSALTQKTQSELRLFLSPDPATPILEPRVQSILRSPSTPAHLSFVPYSSPSKFRRLQMTPSTPFSVDTTSVISGAESTENSASNTPYLPTIASESDVSGDSDSVNFSGIKGHLHRNAQFNSNSYVDSSRSRGVSTPSHRDDKSVSSSFSAEYPDLFPTLKLNYETSQVPTLAKSPESPLQSKLNLHDIAPPKIEPGLAFQKAPLTSSGVVAYSAPSSGVSSPDFNGNVRMNTTGEIDKTVSFHDVSKESPTEIQASGPGLRFYQVGEVNTFYINFVTPLLTVEFEGNGIKFEGHVQALSGRTQIRYFPTRGGDPLVARAMIGNRILLERSIPQLF